MPMPAFQELFLPMLTYIADNNEHTKQDVSEHLALKFTYTVKKLDGDYFEEE